MTSPAMTQAGMILGTAAYMSPEQAKGRDADKRSDVWSFGCVLFEMLSGRRAFAGDGVSDTLAAVLRGDVLEGHICSRVALKVGGPLRESCDARQNLVGRLRPHMEDAPVSKKRGPVRAGTGD